MISIAQMCREGWQRRSINGVRCIVNSQYGFVAPARTPGWDTVSMIRVIQALGQPQNIHRFQKNITTLEYTKLCEEHV